MKPVPAPPDPMTSAEARQLLKRLGWYQADMAEALGITDRSIRRQLHRGWIDPGLSELMRRYAKELSG